MASAVRLLQVVVPWPWSITLPESNQPFSGFLGVYADVKRHQFKRFRKLASCGSCRLNRESAACRWNLPQNTFNLYPLLHWQTNRCQKGSAPCRKGGGLHTVVELWNHNAVKRPYRTFFPPLKCKSRLGWFFFFFFFYREPVRMAISHLSPRLVYKELSCKSQTQLKLHLKAKRTALK